MKTTFTLISLLVAGLFGSKANAAVHSRLHLNLFNDGQFVVMVDGIRYTNVSGHVNINNLRAGTHQVKIVEVFGQGRGRGMGREVLYNGSINIPFSSAVFARLTNNLSLRVTEIQRLQAPNPRNSYHQRYDNRQYRAPSPPARGMDAFVVTKRQMTRTAFDNNRLEIAKQFVRQSNPTSQEVAQLMQLLSFDNSKLNLAKYAYRFTVDKRNYHLVESSLLFDDSVRKLRRFIYGQDQHPHNRHPNKRYR